MSVSADLRKARSFIERGWSQGKYARDADGNACPSGSYRARSWCFNGALSAADISLNTDDFIADTFKKCRVTWNDKPERTQSEVLAKFDELIAKAEAEGL
jgi:hypothetical protein